MTVKNARRLGRVLQGLVLGSALFFALVQLLAMAGGTGVFRYEGF